MEENVNQRVIREFRAGGGRVEGFPAILLLTTAGRRTGRPRTTPLAYHRDGGRYLVFGSNGGAAEHPQWYRNLLAAGGGIIELPDGEGGLTTLSVRPAELDPAERDHQYAEQARRVPSFAAYAERTDRTIPVLALHPLDLTDNPATAAAVVGQLRLHHEDLRRQLADLRTRLDDAGPVPGPDLAAQLRQHCLEFCYGLGMHHTREDGAFTAFERQYPQLIPALARLRAEHRTVAEALTRFEERLAAPGTDAAELRTELDRLTDGLEAHFAYEETHLLPPSAPHLPR
ncbi:nitroreductase/quinone reductase family protein [Kitasatospora sp. NPDC059673]|uniref:nitroreductase/quinone reductase family protein n=1 Tax=Kitasatospora sp. NPDC059673 TaxID=3346901 RepID=UPI0036A42DAC